MAIKRKPSGTSTTPSASTAEPPQSSQRWVISHLISHYDEDDQRSEARNAFSEKFDRHLEAHLDVVSDNKADESSLRRVIVCEGDAEEMMAKARELSADTIIEPELSRTIPHFRLNQISEQQAEQLAAPENAGGPGSGTTLTLKLQGADGSPAVGATVTMTLTPAAQGQTASNSVGGRSNDDGSVTLSYDPSQWVPGITAIEPAGRYWSWVLDHPQDGQVVELPSLPESGPLGWWHLLSGTVAGPDLGAGIKVGVVDTGMGPHPYLSHATAVGAFLNGQFLQGAQAGEDCESHGTHVSGIIAARPAADSKAFAGIAPAAELFMARVFSADGGGNQGDIARAIDYLSFTSKADLINLSLVGAASAIEHDAILAALKNGSLCIAAAGNQGTPISGYPAGYPEVAAVSAIGLPGAYPAGAMASYNLPNQPDRFGYGGCFLAAFSNYGPAVSCTAGGNGIISTVPERYGLTAPYADMSGTSLSSPVAVGALAALLSRDAAYKALPAGISRAYYARTRLSQSCVSLRLNPLYQGAGLARDIVS